uniref:pentapeptide repeat-containing protein n=1 Tax=Neisseria mucosa TaxID=488 RepID=UPI0009BD9EE4
MAKWNIWKKITEIISKSKAWLHGQSNAVKVLCAGAMSVIIFVLAYLAAIRNSDSNSVGYWNFIILIVSAPVAFVIWHFRDENNRQQIENQRKDINLKEFQKLSEWVSGAHLPEIKIVNKTTQKNNLKDGEEITEQTTELSEEYAKKPDTADFDTFSKRDGAVALQISAIYNLLPFFRGDYGESFRRPAFNLLKSAWQAMQQDSLRKLDGDHLSDEERKKIFDELQQRAESPMGVALTQVLLSLNQENKKLNLRDFPEMLPSICLAGMNFHLSGVDEIARDLSGLNLQGANFQKTVLAKADLETANLTGAKLKGAI